MSKFLKSIFLFFKNYYDILRKPAVKFVILLVIVVFALLYLQTQSQEIIDVFKKQNINLRLVALAILLTIMTVVMGTFTWQSILSWLNFKREWADAAKPYAYSALAKYIPGFIWPFASRAYFSHELAIPIKIIMVGIILELIITIMVGTLLACISFMLNGFQYFFNNNLLKFVIPVLGLLVTLIIIVLPGSIAKIINRYLQNHIDFDKKFYFRSIIFDSLGWLLMSGAFWMLISSFGIDDFSFLSSMFFHTTSFVVGSIILPIPNGLIVREATLVFLGRQILGEHLLVATSLVFRTIILMAEGVTTIILFSLSKFNFLKKSA